MEMDALVDAVVKADAKERVEVAEHTAASLALVAPSQIQTSHMADLTTHLANWASSSNYKAGGSSFSSRCLTVMLRSNPPFPNLTFNLPSRPAPPPTPRFRQLP